MDQSTNQPQVSAMPEMSSAPVPPAEPVMPGNTMPEMSSVPVPPVEPVVPLNAMPEMRGGAMDSVVNPAAQATPVMTQPVEQVVPEAQGASETQGNQLAQPDMMGEVSDSALLEQPAEQYGAVGGVGVAGNAQPVASANYPVDNVMLGATDPIMMPETAPEPDPVEEELKAPFKAAEPVPGSIGSAISVPSEDGAKIGANGGNMEFGTAEIGNDKIAVDKKAKSGGKKMSKNTLILLTVVAGLVVVALAIVLITMMK